MNSVGAVTAAYVAECLLVKSSWCRNEHVCQGIKCVGLWALRRTHGIGVRDMPTYCVVCLFVEHIYGADFAFSDCISFVKIHKLSDSTIPS